MELEEIIEYMNDNIRWGSVVNRSSLNNLISQGNGSIQFTYGLYKEAADMNLSIVEDTRNSLMISVIHSESSSWQDDIRTILSGLPEKFHLSDIYLFEFDLEKIHSENRNIRAEIRNALRQLVEKGEIQYDNDESYQKVIISNNSDAQSESDFDDIYDLSDLLNSKEFDGLYKSVEDVPNYSNNLNYIAEYQNNINSKALDSLMKANRQLVYSVARKYASSVTTSYDLDDMVAEGMLGLTKAVEKFDISLGNEFSTYATWWIRQAITRGIADQSTTVRLPVHMREKLNKERKAENRLFSDLGRPATKAEIAAYLDITTEKVSEYQQIQYQFGKNLISLDLPVGMSESDTMLGELIPEMDVEDAFDVASDVMLQQKLSESLSILKEKERKVLILRFGLENSNVHTLEEVGQKMGVTRERIRQIEAKAIRRLRFIAESNHLDDWYRVE